MVKRKRQDEESTIPVEYAELFGAVRPQLKALLEEMRELSKKHPDGVINKFKLRFINEKLQNANVILRDGHKPLKDFDEFGVDDLPTNSDVVLILSQYVGALGRWQATYTYRDDSHRNVWRTNPPIPVE